MSFPAPVRRVEGALPCSVVERLNRFVVLVGVGGRVTRAYINNTGRLSELLQRGRRGYCLPSSGGRTEYRLFAVEDAGGAALIDTRMQMEVFEELVGRGVLPWLRGCRLARRSPRLGSSMLDYLLDCRGQQVYVELKSAVLRLGDAASYPDCPSMRGRRHLRELIEHVRRGGRALLVFVAGFPGPRRFVPNAEADPVIARLVGEAVRAGVDVRAFSIYYEPSSSTIVLESPELPVEA